MAEIRPFRKSTLRQEKEADIDAAQARFCAYNQTAQRFVSNDVEVADVSVVALGDFFSRLTPGSGTALWIVPIRELSATDFRFPVDLLFLDEADTVVEAVQSFPIARIVSTIAGATSVLALPGRASLAARIEAGDHLRICSPEEMQMQLLYGHVPDTSTRPQLVYLQNSATRVGVAIGGDADQLGKWETQAGQDVSSNDKLAAAASFEPSNSTEQEFAGVRLPPHSKDKKTASKKWWQKLFAEEPADPRTAPRKILPGLVAYFFTGSAPVAHPVRDISTSGLYMLTSERWYKGTIVRITLTDEREPTAERSITLHAKVVRWTDDGVALEFMLHDKKERRRGTASTLDNLSGGASVREIAEFIDRF